MMGNVLCGPALNLWARKSRTNRATRFGHPIHTISYCLGDNQLEDNLTKFGHLLCWILDKIDPDHCYKAVVNFRQTIEHEMDWRSLVQKAKMENRKISEAIRSKSFNRHL